MTKNKADTASDAGRDLLARHGGRRFHTILAGLPSGRISEIIGALKRRVEA